MAERRPIVIITGEQQELPDGDTVAGVGTIGLATVSRSHTAEFELSTTPSNPPWNTERITLDPVYFSTATDDDIEVAKTLKYQINVTASAVNSAVADAQTSLRIYVDGSAVTGILSKTETGTAGEIHTISVSVILELTAGERVGPRFSEGSGDTIELLANSMQWTIVAMEAAAGVDVISIGLASVSRSHTSSVSLTTTPSNIAWDTERITLDSTYFETATDDDIQVNKTLNYLISVTATADASGSTDRANLKLYKDGSDVLGIFEAWESNSSTQSGIIHFTTIIPLVSGERIGPRFYEGSGDDVALKSNSALWTIVALEAVAAGGEGSGDFVGPGSAVDGNIVEFDGTTGKLGKDSGIAAADVVEVTDGSITVLHGHALSGEETLETGVITGLTVSINGGDPATFDVAAGKWVIVDWTTPDPPTRTSATFAGATGVALTDIGASFTTLHINASNALIQTPGVLTTPQQWRQTVQIQTVIHTAGVEITDVSSRLNLAYQKAAAIFDWAQAVGPDNVGNTIEAAATDLTIKKVAGVTTAPFNNAGNDRQNPSQVTGAETDPIANLNYSFRDGAGGYSFDATATDLQVDLWDNDTGTPVAVSPSSRFTNTRFFYISATNDIIPVYGQTLYSSLVDAVQAIPSEVMDINPNFTNLPLVTVISASGNTTDLTDPSDVIFTTPISGLGGAGAGSTTFLGLLDTDDVSYSGKDGQAVLGNPGETGLILTQLDHDVHLDNVGTNGHAAIDSHIADTTAHSGLLDLAGTRPMTGSLTITTGDFTISDGVIVLSNAGDNTTIVSSLTTAGANGATLTERVGTTLPNGSVTGLPGARYTRTNGVETSLWIHKGTGSSNSDWVELGTTVGGSGLLSTTHRFDTDVSGSAPASGRLKYNNATPASVTIVRISKTSLFGTAIDNLLGALSIGDLIGAKEDDDSSRSDVFDISGSPTNQTTHYDFPVTHRFSEANTLRNNRELSVEFLFAAGTGDVVGPAGGVVSDEVPVFSDTSGKLIGGSGILSANISVSGHTHTHASTTGQGVDDHHNQVHDLSGSDHNSSTLAAFNAKISDATLDDSGDSRPPDSHAFAGADHSTSTIAQVNTKISDATLDDSGDSRPPNGTAGGDLNGSFPNPGVDDGADGTAFHTDANADISGLTQKVTPTGADHLFINDAAASNAPRRVLISSLPTGLDADAIHDNVAGEIVVITEKTALLGDDEFVLESAADSNDKRSAKLRNILPVIGVWPVDTSLGTSTISSPVLTHPKALRVRRIRAQFGAVTASGTYTFLLKSGANLGSLSTVGTVTVTTGNSAGASGVISVAIAALNVTLVEMSTVGTHSGTTLEKICTITAETELD